MVLCNQVKKDNFAFRGKYRKHIIDYHLIINKVMYWDSSVYYVNIFISILIFVSGKQGDVLKIKFLSVFDL